MQHAIIAIEDERFYENDGVDLRGIGRALFTGHRRAAAPPRAARRSRSSSSRTRPRRRAAARSSRRSARRRSPTTSRASGPSARSSRSTSTRSTSATAPTASSRPRARTSARRPSTSAAASARTAARASCCPTRRRCWPAWSPRRAPTTRSSTARRRRGGATSCCAKMLEQGYITRTEYEGAIQRAGARRATTIHPPQAQAASKSSAYFATWVRQQVVDRFGPREALLGGLRVQTTLDLGMQRRAEDAITRWLGNPPSGRRRRSSRSTTRPARCARWSAATTTTARRSTSPRRASASRARRSSRSSWRPRCARGSRRARPGRPSKQVIQVPNSIEKFTVNNYENAYSGVSTLARATTFSDNAVYAQVGIKAGTKRIARTAERMGIRTPVSSNYAITLGGLQAGRDPAGHGARLPDVRDRRPARHAAASARGKRGPVGIRKVTLRDDRKRVLRRNRPKRTRVIPKSVAATTTVDPRVGRQGRHGEGGGLGKVRAWGKTGTTENYGDAWFVGATDKYTVAVWVGYPERAAADDARSTAASRSPAARSRRRSGTTSWPPSCRPSRTASSASASARSSSASPTRRRRRGASRRASRRTRPRTVPGADDAVRRRRRPPTARRRRATATRRPTTATRRPATAPATGRRGTAPPTPQRAADAGHARSRRPRRRRRRPATRRRRSRPRGGVPHAALTGAPSARPADRQASRPARPRPRHVAVARRAEAPRQLDRARDADPRADDERRRAAGARRRRAELDRAAEQRRRVEVQADARAPA